MGKKNRTSSGNTNIQKRAEKILGLHAGLINEELPPYTASVQKLDVVVVLLNAQFPTKKIKSIPRSWHTHIHNKKRNLQKLTIKKYMLQTIRDKDFITIILNVSKELKENTSKELKEIRKMI